MYYFQIFFQANVADDNSFCGDVSSQVQFTIQIKRVYIIYHLWDFLIFKST